MIKQSHEVIQVVRDRMQEAQSRQKAYADKRLRPLEFDVEDMVMLKVAPIKGVKRFGSKGKLEPRYIGPFRIVERIGKRAYRLLLPDQLKGVHDVFHVSILKKYLKLCILYAVLNRCNIPSFKY